MNVLRRSIAVLAWRQRQKRQFNTYVLLIKYRRPAHCALVARRQTQTAGISVTLLAAIATINNAAAYPCAESDQ